MPNKIALTHAAAQFAQEAGRLIRCLRDNGVAIAATKSSSTDIVTIADQRSEQLLVQRIRERFPEHGIIGEEGTQVNTDAQVLWVLDPIDGTVNYLYDLPGYCVSVAAATPCSTALGGFVPFAAAVFVPRTNELFTATAGHGAYCNGKRLQVSAAAKLQTALLATGFGYAAKNRAAQAAALTEVLPRVRDIRRSGAAAYDLALVAAGRIDAYYESGIKPWDWAAGSLLVTEAGGVFTTHTAADGQEVFVAGNPALTTALTTLPLA